ncbi:MAG: PAS domain-containing sensor histidine kinase [Prevotella sp.]|nr:PAS domain-containing sensor histidine kinase [Prevotella sp.]
MNILLTDITTQSSQYEVQSISMLMVLMVIIVFIISWVFNRISILRIRKNTDSIKDLSTVLQQTLNINGNYVIKLTMQDRMGYNMHGNFLPAGGMSYQESFEYIHPDDREKYVVFLKRLIDGDMSSECTFRWDTSGKKHLGHWRYINDTGIAEFRNKNLKTSAVIYCTLRDKTEQIEQEQMQNQLADKYRRVFEQSITGLAFYDKDGMLITANKKMQEILKFQSEDDPFYYERAIYDLPTFREILDNHHLEEFFFCRKSVILERGVNCYVEIRLHPIYDNEGALIYINLSTRDVTQERLLVLQNKENDESLRRTNEEIQQYETELQYVMEKCEMRFFRISFADRTCTFYKSMNKPEIQISFDELIEHFIISPLSKEQESLEEYFKKPRTDLTKMHPFFHEGEELQWNFIDSVPSYDENGKLTGTYGLIRNVNALIEKQEQLKRETERANQSGMMKSTFMANMTHEIRTPLNAIVGFSDVLPMLTTPEEKQEIIRVIMNNCDMLMRLINDVLAVSELEGGNISIQPIETDFAKAFDDMCISLAQRVQTPGVEFISDNPYTSLVTTIDKERILQVLTNFVTNAVKYTQQGHIKVGYEYRETDGGGLYLYCEDTGAGIKKKDQSKVFERFVKLNDYVQGTGLGLNISKAIAESCKGKIGVESEGEGKGCTFWVWIPCEATINNQ